MNDYRTQDRDRLLERLHKAEEALKAANIKKPMNKNTKLIIIGCALVVASASMGSIAEAGVVPFPITAIVFSVVSLLAAFAIFVEVSIRL